jgi:predicted TIM-barrel fold metal-dependent hydrolase
MIIDVHAHLGKDFVFDAEQDERTLIDAYDAFGVDKAIIQPYICRPYPEDTRLAHDRIFALCNAYPGRFYGMASINPHFYRNDFDKEAIRCVREYGFLGLKITTIGHAVNPSSSDGMHVFEVAKDLDVPVMIHTGLGAPLAAPVAAWRAIEAFPTVKIVLAHTGGNEMQEQALMLARRYDNVYLEPSWMPGVCIAAMVKSVGADRVLFSSDDAANLGVALATFRLSIRDQDDLDTILGRTAHEVYKI